MRLTSVLRFCNSHVFCQINIRASAYHNRGKPVRVLRDDGSDYFAERNVTPKTSDYRRKLERLERMERLQFENSSSPNDHKRLNSSISPKKRRQARANDDVGPTTSISVGGQNQDSSRRQQM